MDRERFFDYLDAYWPLAEKAGLRAAKDVRRMFQAIRESEPSVGKWPEDVSNKTGEPYPSGYRTKEHLLWVRRNELKRLAATMGQEHYDKDFAGDKDAFIRLTTNFVMSGSFEQLRREQRLAVLEQFPSGCGAVLVGKSEPRTQREILWIGIANDLDIAKLPIGERVARLRSPISRFYARERLPWVSHSDVARNIAGSTPDAIRAAVRELFAARITSLGDSVDLLYDAGEDETSIVWYAPAWSEELVHALSDHELVPVIVVGLETFDELRAVLTSFLAAHPKAAGTPFVILDRERLADELSHHPWLWSKYLARDMPFAIVEREDETQMRDTLGIARDAPLVAHPALSRGLNTRRVRVAGHLGSGKTYALLQVFRGMLLQHAIVLRAAAEERHIELCDAILKEALDDRALIIIDDLEQHMFDAPARSPLGRLIDRLHTRGNETCMVVVAYDSAASAKVEQHFGPYLADFTTSIDLDTPPHAFIVDVLQTVAAARRVDVDAYALQRTATILQGWENTPAVAARYVMTHEPGSHLGIPETIKDIPRAPPQVATRDARFVLRIIAVLRAAGITKPAIRTVRLLFEHLIDAKDYARFDEALRQLVEERRIRTTTLSIIVMGSQLKVLMAADESDFQHRFGDAVDAVLDGIDEHDRRALLFSEGERSLRLDEADRARSLVERLRVEAALLFADYQERFAMGFLKAGDGETAVRYLQEYVIQHPEELHWRGLLQFLTALSPADQRTFVTLGAMDVVLTLFLQPEKVTTTELDAVLDVLTRNRSDDTPDEQARRDRVISMIRAWRERLS